MKIEFCPCGGIFAPAGGKQKCRNCGKEVLKRAGVITTEQNKKDIIVIEDNKPDLPSTAKECPRCGGERAYWWLIQTRSADEPPTQFFKCVKCKHTWREYK